MNTPNKWKRGKDRDRQCQQICNRSEYTADLVHVVVRVKDWHSFDITVQLIQTEIITHAREFLVCFKIHFNVKYSWTWTLCTNKHHFGEKRMKNCVSTHLWICVLYKLVKINKLNILMDTPTDPLKLKSIQISTSQTLSGSPHAWINMERRL